METQKWFVLRDLKRPNAKLPAWKMLTDDGFEVFTPMRERLREHCGREIRVVDGPLQGYTGRILKLRGRSKPRLLVQLHELLTAAVEIERNFIEFV